MKWSQGGFINQVTLLGGGFLHTLCDIADILSHTCVLVCHWGNGVRKFTDLRDFLYEQSTRFLIELYHFPGEGDIYNKGR